jgi:hypothetical protein
MKIDNSSDWQLVDLELSRQIRSLNFNSDLNKMKRNLEKMVTELNKSEVEARRVKTNKYIRPKIDEINIAIDQLEKLIIVLILRQ